MAHRDLIQRQTSLTANLLGLFRFLRKQGYRIGPAEEADVLRAIELLEAVKDPELFRAAVKTVVCRSISQKRKFDDLYDQYWKELEKAVDSKVADAPDKNGSQQAQNQPSFQALKSWLQGNTQEEKEETASYSAQEAIGQKDFASFSEEELEEILQLIQLIARSLAFQFSRRQKKTHRHSRLDLRRTLRNNLRRGGEIVDLAFRKPPRNKRRILLLCDVSKSMDLYSQFLIQFIYAFQNAYRSIETFVFSTSLHRVSPQLKNESFRAALRELSEQVPDWSGGTQIGQSLHTFCKEYAGRYLNRNTIVLILSDGWDTGDVDKLQDSMKMIHAKAAKVIWLNPLAGNPAFQPTVQGMVAAMPYIDIFASAHNAASLRKIASHLRKR